MTMFVFSYCNSVFVQTHIQTNLCKMSLNMNVHGLGIINIQTGFNLSRCVKGVQPVSISLLPGKLILLEENVRRLVSLLCTRVHTTLKLSASQRNRVTGCISLVGKFVFVAVRARK